MIVVIGISGKAGHGKDSCARFIKDILDEYYCSRATIFEYKDLNFATALKEIVGDFFRLDHDQLYDPELKEKPIERLSGFTPRKLLQIIGTDIGRNIWESIWVDHYDRRLGSICYDFVVNRDDSVKDFFVFTTDIRFKNEFDYMRNIKSSSYVTRGFLIRVERPGFAISENMHASETDLDDITGWDYVITANNLDELFKNTTPVVKDIIGILHE